MSSLHRPRRRPAAPATCLLLAGLAAAQASRPAAGPSAPAWTLDLRDGTEVTGTLHAVRPGAAAPELVLVTPAGERAVALADLVGGRAEPRPALGTDVGGVARSPVELRLAGGEVHCGAVLGGDPSGEWLELRSGSLGDVRVPLDRIALVLFTGRLQQNDPRQFAAPRPGSTDETLFQRTRGGIDAIDGIVNRFTPEGVLFHWGGSDQPDVFRYEKLVAIAFRNAVAPKEQMAMRWLLRDGSLVDAAPAALQDGRLRLTGAGGTGLAVDPSDVSAFAVRGAGHRFVSELTPKQVLETPYLGGPEDFLFPHQRDRSVSGGYLTVAGRSFVRGIGCHSKTVLTYDVPPGFTVLRTRVGIDDEARRLAVPGNVVFRVLVDGRQVAVAEGVRGGEAPRRLPDIPLAGAAEFTLEVDFGADFHLGDRADWLAPVLVEG
jgi:hypothetical protein